MARTFSGCEVLHQDFLALSLPPNHFDGIFANASLFHIPSKDLPRVLGELRAALRPSGVLVCSNPRGDDVEGWSGDRYSCFFEIRSMAGALHGKRIRRARPLLQADRQAPRAATMARDDLAIPVSSKREPRGGLEARRRRLCARLRPPARRARRPPRAAGRRRRLGRHGGARGAVGGPPRRRRHGRRRGRHDAGARRRPRHRGRAPRAARFSLAPTGRRARPTSATPAAATTTSRRSTCSPRWRSRSRRASRPRSRRGTGVAPRRRAIFSRACSPTTSAAARRSSRWPRSR